MVGPPHMVPSFCCLWPVLLCGPSNLCVTPAASFSEQGEQWASPAGWVGVLVFKTVHSIVSKVEKEHLLKDRYIVLGLSLPKMENDHPHKIWPLPNRASLRFFT